MSKPLISVIVPVYNSEVYLDQCINSILGQSFGDFELLLVNDGSTDNSGKVCDKYEQLDERVKVVHKANAGVGSARNYGIQSAQGEYITFVDSDDFCQRELLEQLVTAIEKEQSDFAVAGFSYFYSEKRIMEQIMSVAGTFSTAEFVSDHFGEAFNKNILSGPCSKLFRTDLIKRNKLSYSEKYSIGEDGIFSYGYVMHCNTLEVVPRSLYFYRQRADEVHLMSVYHPNATEALHCYYLSLLKVIQKYGAPQSVVDSVDAAFLSRLLHVFGQVYSRSTKTASEKYKELLRLSSLTFFRQLLSKKPHGGKLNKEKALLLLLEFKICRIPDLYWRVKHRKGR